MKLKSVLLALSLLGIGTIATSNFIESNNLNYEIDQKWIQVNEVIEYDADDNGNNVTVNSAKIKIRMDENLEIYNGNDSKYKPTFYGLRNSKIISGTEQSASLVSGEVNVWELSKPILLTTADDGEWYDIAFQAYTYEKGGIPNDLDKMNKEVVGIERYIPPGLSGGAIVAITISSLVATLAAIYGSRQYYISKKNK